MAILPNFFIKSVVPIGVKGEDENINWIGTGFCIVKKVGINGGLPFLVTNKHVVLKQKEIIIKMEVKDSDNLKTISIPLSKNNNLTYFVHPNPNIDLALILLNANNIQKDNLDFNGFDIDEHAMSSEELRNNEVDEGSLIYMLGFPMGLVNIDSTTPICRLGCIARIDKKQIDSNYNFLADIQNFPGNSGSPIILRLESATLQGTKCLNKTVLIGVVHSYIPYKEPLINMQTKQIVEVHTENSGIAYVHPIEYIREILDSILKIQQ